jgi:hypothetical protein
MEKPYVPEKWKNLKLEIDENYTDNDCKIYEPRIIRTESIIKYDSILKNKKDVFKENHKNCDYDEDCYKPKVSYKCVIL